MLVVFSGKELLGKLKNLLNNILQNGDNWTLPEPPREPIQKKRGILFLSPEDMQEAKKSMKEKCIKAEDVKNLPPIEEIHGLDTPPPPQLIKGLLLIAIKAKSLFISMVMSTLCTSRRNNSK